MRGRGASDSRDPAHCAVKYATRNVAVATAIATSFLLVELPLAAGAALAFQHSHCGAGSD